MVHLDSDCRDSSTLLGVMLFSFCLLVGVPAGPAAAQVEIGPQVSLADTWGLGIGARLTAPLGAEEGFASRIRLGVMGDYYFVDDAEVGNLTVTQSFWDLNGFAAYMFDVDAEVEPYAGAGLTFGRFSTGRDIDGEQFASGSESELGVSVLGGILLETIPMFAELRFSSVRAIDLTGSQSSGLHATVGLSFSP